MTIEEINKLSEKAKTRKDGIYKLGCEYWAVKDKRFIALVNKDCELLLRNGSFNIYLGTFVWIGRKEKFKQWLKSYKEVQSCQK